MRTDIRSSRAVAASRHKDLPKIVRAKQGHMFDPSQDIWILRELTHEVRLRFNTMPYLGGRFLAAFKAVLVWYAQNHSIGYVRTLYSSARQLFTYKAETTGVPVIEITGADILSYRAHIGKVREWRLASASALLRQWYSLGFAGVASDAATLLNQLRLKGSTSGVAVATLDPEFGPFTALEHEALQRALNDAFAHNDVTLSEYVLCWLFIALGMRPTQYARLKVCDIKLLHSQDGSATYSVRMPRAKQKGATSAREQFKDCVLSPAIGKRVLELAREVESRFNGIIDDPTQAPLFVDERSGSGPPSVACHLQADAIGKAVRIAMGRLNVRSERTGKALKVHAKRFRMTVGTRAAEEGHGELVIAELLDHSNTANVGVYIRSTPTIVRRIDRAVAMRLAPLARAFSGKLISGPTELSEAGCAKVIRAPEITGNFHAISTCGKDGNCYLLKPIACYTCNSFEPWLDAPHERVLAHLLAERDRLMGAGDSRIAAINDRAILAVAEVIQRCAAANVAGTSANG